MNAFGILLLAMLTTATVAEDPVQSVELVLQTRGVYKSVTIDAQHTQIEVNGQKQQLKTKPRQWQAILSELKGVKLADLPLLTGDVSRSSVDAALSAHLRVTTTSQAYESAPYDHPSPPAALTKLIRTITGGLPPESRKAFR